jgi:hypothetical protein
MAPKKDKKTKTKTKTKQKQKQKQTQKVIVNVGTAAVRQARRNKRPAGSRAPMVGPAPPNVLAPPPLPMAPTLGHVNQAGAGVGVMRPPVVENTNTVAGGNVTVNMTAPKAQAKAKAKAPKKIGIVPPQLDHAVTPRTRTKAKMAETKAIQDEAPIARRVKVRREIAQQEKAKNEIVQGAQSPELAIASIVRAGAAPVNRRSIAQQARWARVRQASVAPVPEFSTPAASGDTELSHQAF